ncbi:sel1 repeat family protein [Eikenella sp. S3360]|uniref:Sel1 repeat family protein n=1 Tax=Eikenella glucosivorans TaxID=2766967 RepID=A0ABS0N838_9NEIS|nr:tetratricopeptide repeat protein [Eikenella glucosivorans]MBH5328476.1 sel1 repeat family protein [Eikenella glucosivorans]
MQTKTLALTAAIFVFTACTAVPTHNVQAKALLDEGIALYQKQDYANARPYFEQARQAGHMKAPRYLGLMSLNGEGVEKDAQAAFAYFTQAAEAGDITGQYWLGYCYENGIGTAKDLTQAVRWYQKSAARGDHVSQPAMDALNRLGVKAN